MTFLKNVLNVLPGIVGVAQAILPMVKEVIVLVVRIIGTLPFLWSAPQPIIEVIDEWYEKIIGIVEKIKNLFLSAE